MALEPSIMPCGSWGWGGGGGGAACPHGYWAGRGPPELGDATLVVTGGCKPCFRLNSWPRG